MAHRTNEHGHPIGSPLPNCQPPPPPPKTVLQGHFFRIEPIDTNTHVEELYIAISLDEEARSWTYLAYGPFVSIEDYRAWIEATCLGDDPIFFAIINGESSKAVGVASYLNIVPANGSIEIGHIHYSPRRQRVHR